MHYQEVKDLCEKYRNRKKKVAQNTYAIALDDYTFAIRFYNTNIITFYSNGDVMLDSGDWRTATTKQRMNHFLDSGIRVIQDKGEWWVHHNGMEVPFRDGIIIGKYILSEDEKHQEEVP